MLRLLQYNIYPLVYVVDLLTLAESFRSELGATTRDVRSVPSLELSSLELILSTTRPSIELELELARNNKDGHPSYPSTRQNYTH